MLKNVRLSLKDLLGEKYVASVCAARAFLTGESEKELRRIAEEKIDCWPEAFARRQEELMVQVGGQAVPAFDDTEPGAPTHAYGAAQHAFASPLSALGAFRLGEDGRLYFAGKSEHYQIPLGHAFPGYRLIENAKRLGIPNATHNNTRGFVTRTLERRLIAAANGVAPDDPEMETILREKKPGMLNTVINLETGSLAVEAALKMMLARFYSLEGREKTPYEGKIPVFLVMADHGGGPTGNYHGTTVLAQTLRGLWPEWYEESEAAGLYQVVPVPINDLSAFEKSVRKYNQDSYKTAGFCHEIIMMNYGGIRLEEEYLKGAYALCRETDTPVLCDEIQSCAWYDGLFLFRKYGLTPDFVSVGKGFPGGEYPASKVLASGAFDSLSQFGALVTNGQEELASLAYLITMAFIRENGAEIEAAGRYYHESLSHLAKKYPALLDGVTGDGQMSALSFRRMDQANVFCRYLNNTLCIDASAQTYKKSCPPVVLTKLPLIVSPAMMDQLIERMEEALAYAEKEAI
ncbi:MAG: aminotransferase class III-fold pyridoxal phosphate-dependent enzyme [Clostridia bacterium]|nr:aminotransferase class III-fold pyridoxal phosphate-dependent enzyme [Clostridia bacterium]